MSEQIHVSDKTKIILKEGKIHKKFIGDEAQIRFEKELSFLKLHQSDNLPKLYDFDSKNLTIILAVLKSDMPGFLDNTEASLLTSNDFQRIRRALNSIQELSPKLLVHGDLAPHNIYVTSNRVVIADWDSYFYAENPNYNQYDYATLWSLMDTNESDLISIFDEELLNMKKDGVFESFSYCYKKRIDFLQKYPKQFAQGIKIREYILSQLE